MKTIPIKLIECPRDAMQGIDTFIPTEVKADYINSLLNLGFDTIDFGSFVSPQAIPQLKDTAEVLSKLNLQKNSSKLLAIIANYRGATNACSFDEISYLGFPFSISETFQQRNTNSSIEASLRAVDQIQNLCIQSGKELLIYISMGFGNPYGDLWNVEIVEQWVKKLADSGIRIMALSDTIGVSTPSVISYLYSNLIPAFPHIEFGAHLHSTPDSWKEKIASAYENGCRRFDSAIGGWGGCPMAKDELTGNIATENILSYLEEIKISSGINMEGFRESITKSVQVFHS